jgi:hypothetical protein
LLRFLVLYFIFLFVFNFFSLLFTSIYFIFSSNRSVFVTLVARMDGLPIDAIHWGHSANHIIINLLASKLRYSIIHTLPF